jgi:hypothetical protein
LGPKRDVLESDRARRRQSQVRREQTRLDGSFYGIVDAGKSDGGCLKSHDFEVNTGCIDEKLGDFRRRQAISPRRETVERFI